jgi:hypothetical protein
MADRHSSKKVRPERIIKPPEERVQRVSLTLPGDVASFLRSQGNADKFVSDLIYKEMNKKEAVPDE